jgi:hypothetical protein
MFKPALIAALAVLGVSVAAPADARMVKRITKITTTTTTTYHTATVRVPPRMVPQPYPVYRTVYQPVYQPVYRTIYRPVPVYQTRVIRETWVPRPVYYRRAPVFMSHVAYYGGGYRHLR